MAATQWPMELMEGISKSVGFPVVICGPGNIAQAHQPDEFIELSEFNSGAQMLERLLESLQTA